MGSNAKIDLNVGKGTHLKGYVDMLLDNERFINGEKCLDPMVGTIALMAHRIAKDPEWTVNYKLHSRDCPNIETFIYRTFLTAHKFKTDKLNELHPIYLDGNKEEYIKKAREIKALGKGQFALGKIKELGYQGVYDFAIIHGAKMAPIIKELLFKGLGPADFAAAMKKHLGYMSGYHLGRLVKGMSHWDKDCFDMDGHQVLAPNSSFYIKKLVKLPLETVKIAINKSGLDMTLYETEAAACEFVKYIKYKRGIKSFEKVLKDFVKEFYIWEDLLPYPLVEKDSPYEQLVNQWKKEFKHAKK